MQHRTSIWTAAAFVVAASLGLAPVAQGQRANTPHHTVAPATPSSSVRTPPHVVTVHAVDFAFMAPDRIPSGMTTFRFMNDGKTFHHMTIIRLDDGKTMADLAAAFKQPGPPPHWAVFMGGPNAPDPGHESNATLNMQPGNYALVCFVDVPGGVPHFARGMMHALTVVGTAAPAASAPVADATITLSDYKFALSHALTAGHHTIEVRNTAAQPHEVEIIQLAPGKTAQDMLNWVGKPQGPPPGHGIGGVAANSSGAPAYFTADLVPGSYALVCFAPDAKDGKPHFMHGMVHTITVQ